MSDEKNKELEWTGERYVPQIPGNIRLEHLHRYLIARELSHDRRVLDIACGEGYGSDLLATVATEVVGVDVAKDVIAHASARYVRPNLLFKQGACEAIPLPDHSVDVVVSFETIEHVRLQQDMLREIRRVLCADGLLVISSPDRRVYSDVLGNKNIYHVGELDRAEFEQLLRSYFHNIVVGGQRIRGGSIVGPLAQSTETSFASFPFVTDSYEGVVRIQGVEAPAYLVALASDQPLPALPVGLLDGGDLAWASDWPAALIQVQAQLVEEISRRLGYPVHLEGASNDEILAEFTRQANHVSTVVRMLGVYEANRGEAERQSKAFEQHIGHLSAELARAHSDERTVGGELLEGNRKLGEELERLRGFLSSELEHAHARAQSVGTQLLEAHAQLAEAFSDLSASRAMVKAHAAAEEWLEHKTQRLQASLETHRQASRDREGHLTRELVRLQAELTASHQQLSNLQPQLSAQLEASRAHMTHLQEQVSQLEAQIEIYERSRSWRLTAPLRAARRRGRPAHPAPPPTSARRQPTVGEPVKDAVTIPEPAQAQQAETEQALPKWVYEEETADYVPLSRSTPVGTRIKLVAFYLPQFHPIPENDAWWGKGFTEWTSVTRAKPQFEGHYQPHLPGELGFYDLRLPEIQRRQVELAKLHGIHGFCYYHYWFNGKKLLQRPLDHVLATPDLDFPFCLCWANENWTRRWDGRDDERLISQQHSAEDDLEFIRDLEPALRDPRYIRIGGRPLLMVYRPALFPDAGATAERWRVYCREVGLGELFLMTTHSFDQCDPRDFGFDAALEFVPNTVPTPPITAEMPHLNPDFQGVVYDYRYLAEMSLRREAPDGYRLFRSVMPMWDNTARRPHQGAVYAHSSPALYSDWLERTCRWTERHVGIDKPFVFVNAWNEWGEGTHLEPDRRHGYAYLKGTADALEKFPVRGKRPSIVCVSHDAYFYGAQVLALNIVRTLSSRLGYDADVILCGPGQLTTEFEAVARVHDFARAGLTRDEKLAVIRQLYDQGARIAICNTSVVGEAVELLKLAGFSVISLVHELPGVIEQYKLESSVRQIATHADHLVFAADRVRDRFVLLARPPLDRCVVQPQGLFAPNEFFGHRESARRELRVQLGLPAPARIVLAVGNADHRKGIDLFVDAGIRVSRHADDVVFVWVGHQNTPAFASAQARVMEVGLADRFVFPGPIRNSDLFFAGADAYLMSSREDPFPNVVVQALDAGLPIIGFEGAGGFVELLQRGCGLLVPAGDTDAMATAVLRVLSSPEEVEKLSKVGREILAQEFSFVNYARRLVELVEPGGPKVSVIVPSYNYARYLPERLQSIIAQTYQPYEVLFLDDCSTDNSVEIAAAMLHASGLSYRIIANEANQGTYRQWLRGIREAKGDLIWIAEADDHCAPGLLERLVRQFERPDVVLAYCQSRQIDEDGRELASDYLGWTADISETKWRQAYVRPGIDEISDTLAVKNTIPNVSGVLMRRPDLSGIEHKLVTLRNAGDWLLYVHLLEQGSIAFVPDVLNSHRRHGASVTMAGNGLNLMREILMVQRHVIQRHSITRDTDDKRENDLQRTYEYLGLSTNGPASYKDHEALRAVEWAAAV